MFEAKTLEGYNIKILIELLQNTIRTGCFIINEGGISLCMMDTHKKVLINLNLKAQNFNTYTFTPKGCNPKKDDTSYHRDEKWLEGSEDSIYIGINLSHLHKMLKTIKKKDSIILFINDENPTDLGIKVIPKENNRVTTSTIKIQETQNIDVELPEDYSKPIVVPSSEFQKMCKDMGNISNNINIVVRGPQITFSCDAGGLYSREVTFGEDLTTPFPRVDDEKGKPQSAAQTREVVAPIEYSDSYDTELLTRIIKLAGLSNNIKIYYGKESTPLLLKSKVGSLGKISIYIKSKAQIEDDKRMTMEDD